jgi:hypothetical protein
VRPATDAPFDVLIVSCGAGASAPAHELRRELVHLGLRVQIDPMPLPSTVLLPDEFVQHARLARFCVLFMELNQDAQGRPAKTIAYIAAPAPGKAGCRSAVGGIGKLMAAAGVETGRVSGTLTTSLPGSRNGCAPENDGTLARTVAYNSGLAVAKAGVSGAGLLPRLAIVHMVSPTTHEAARMPARSPETTATPSDRALSRSGCFAV